MNLAHCSPMHRTLESEHRPYQPIPSEKNQPQPSSLPDLELMFFPTHQDTRRLHPRPPLQLSPRPWHPDPPSASLHAQFPPNYSTYHSHSIAHANVYRDPTTDTDASQPAVKQEETSTVIHAETTTPAQTQSLYFDPYYSQEPQLSQESGTPYVSQSDQAAVGSTYGEEHLKSDGRTPHPEETWQSTPYEGPSALRSEPALSPKLDHTTPDNPMAVYNTSTGNIPNDVHFDGEDLGRALTLRDSPVTSTRAAARYTPYTHAHSHTPSRNYTRSFDHVQVQEDYPQVQPFPAATSYYDQPAGTSAQLTSSPSCTPTDNTFIFSNQEQGCLLELDNSFVRPTPYNPNVDHQTQIASLPHPLSLSHAQRTRKVSNSSSTTSSSSSYPSLTTSTSSVSSSSSSSFAPSPVSPSASPILLPYPIVSPRLAHRQGHTQGGGSIGIASHHRRRVVSLSGVGAGIDTAAVGYRVGNTASTPGSSILSPTSFGSDSTTTIVSPTISPSLSSGASTIGASGSTSNVTSPSVPSPMSATRTSPLHTSFSPRHSHSSPLPNPVPVPNLIKKSRGRRVPTIDTIRYADQQAVGSIDGNGGHGRSRSMGEFVAGSSSDGVGYEFGYLGREDGFTTSGKGNNVRSFACKVLGCGKLFARGEHLKRHVRSIHTYEKPHKCPYPGCGKDFSRHDNLGQHMRVHKDYVMPPKGSNYTGYQDQERDMC